MFWEIEHSPHQTKSDLRRARREASRSLGRHVCFGGKGSSPPPAPDYVGAAQATAAGNADAARVATTANRVSQYTPYGSIVYSQTNPGKLDQGKYDQALAAYHAGTGPKPNQADFMVGGNPDLWRADVRLSPAQQQILNAQNQTSLSLADLAGKGLTYVQDTLSKPFDTSGIPGNVTSVQQQNAAGPVSVPGQYTTSVNGGDLDGARLQAQQAVYNRQTSMLDPQYRNMQHDLESQLANQGLARGSEAYSRAMDDFSRQRDFAYGQARDAAVTQGDAFAQQQFQQGLANAGLANNARQSNFSEGMQNAQLQNAGAQQTFNQGLANANLTNSEIQQLLQQRNFLRNEPLNMLNAVRTGAQVTNPTFASVPQQQTTPGANILGAVQLQGQDALSRYNASQAASNGFASGLFGLGGSALGAAGNAGGWSSLFSW